MKNLPQIKRIIDAYDDKLFEIEESRGTADDDLIEHYSNIFENWVSELSSSDPWTLYNRYAKRNFWRTVIGSRSAS